MLDGSKSSIEISIHALLAESDRRCFNALRSRSGFLSTLSLRRATARRASRQQPAGISIHALLAESDSQPNLPGKIIKISIHALLAESDKVSALCKTVPRDFYPRSPCGERPKRFPPMCTINHFYPRSPCGERRWLRCWQLAARDISIHALLAESDQRT